MKSIQKLNSFNTNDEKNRFVINQCNEMFPDEEVFIQKIRNYTKWRNGRMKNILMIFMIILSLISITIAIYLSYKLYCIENNNKNIKILIDLLDRNNKIIEQNNDIINRLLDKIYIY